jgi:hypothetical protein
MEVEMNRVRVLLGIAAVTVFLVSLSATLTAQTPAEKTWTGQLVKVDTTAKLVSGKGADQKEMSFSYNDETQVVSPEKTIQGLTGKTGSDLRITYREERGSNMATKIELVEKQPAK